jgi:hypothetical protein
MGREERSRREGRPREGSPVTGEVEDEGGDEIQGADVGFESRGVGG